MVLTRRGNVGQKGQSEVNIFIVLFSSYLPRQTTASVSIGRLCNRHMLLAAVSFPGREEEEKAKTQITKPYNTTQTQADSVTAPRRSEQQS